MCIWQPEVSSQIENAPTYRKSHRAGFCKMEAVAIQDDNPFPSGAIATATWEPGDSHWTVNVEQKVLPPLTPPPICTTIGMKDVCPITPTYWGAFLPHSGADCMQPVKSCFNPPTKEPSDHLPGIAPSPVPPKVPEGTGTQLSVVPLSKFLKSSSVAEWIPCMFELGKFL